tara:strand:- start:480 stop:1163 length:684 start_codon:yes stop_codon:yes gene_type:complete
MKKKLIIFGDGEISDIAFFYFSKKSDYEVCAFVVDKPKNDKFNSLPLIPKDVVEKEFPKEEYFIHVALSYKKLNKNRQEKFDFFDLKKYKFASFISDKATILTEPTNLGRNLFILEEQSIQVGVKVMDNVMIWSNNHIGHNSIIGKHTYISSNVTISGHCNIGQRCFFGVNSSVTDFCKIGDDCFITMGSIISSNLKSDCTTINKSTEIYDSNSRVNKSLKKKYFEN